MNVRLYLLQRLTAVIMLPLILGHLAIIFYATRKGISAAEILSRTKGNLYWAAYYSAFVIAASVHAAIGVRVVLQEWGRLRGRGLDFSMWALGLLLCMVGMRAVAAVTL